MQHSHNSAGKEQYADIMEITRNVLMLVLDGGISIPVTTGEDTYMAEETFEYLCLKEIHIVFESRKGKRLFDSDLSSVAL